MALFRRFVVAGAVILAVALPSFGAKAENEAPTLDVTPASIEGRALTASEPIHVQVRLKSGSEELNDVSLSSFSNDGITATLEGQDSALSVAKLAANAEYVWKLRLAPSKGDALAPANRLVDFTAAFRQGKEAPLQHYLFKDLKIAPLADSGAPSLNVEPATIEGRTVSRTGPIEVEVRISAGNYDLTDIALSSFSNDGIVSTIVGGASPTVARLPANAEHVWRVQLAPGNGDALAPTALGANFTVAFIEARDEPRQLYLFKDIKINAPTAVTAPTLLDIEIKGSLDALSHERYGQLFVIATNKYSKALQVARPLVQISDYITVDPFPETQAWPADLAYGGVKVFTYKVTAKDQVVPGKYPIVVTLSATTPEGLSGAVVKSQDIDVAVLGESDLLTKLGAPSILFLPGVLFLLGWQLLWSVGKPKTERDTYEMTPASGGFWVVAVVISMVFFYAYPKVTRLFGPGRDVLAGYGLKDFVYLFTITLGSACVLYVLWLFVKWVASKVRQLIAWWTVPAAGDPPQEILRKLGWVRASIVCKLAHPAAPADAAQRVFILEPWREAAFLWVAPRLQVQETDNAPTKALNFLQEVRTGQITSAWRIHGWVKKGARKGWWTLQWIAVGTLVHPRKDAANNWPEAAGEERRLME